MAVSFYLQKTKEDAEAPSNIYISFTFNTARVATSTGFKVLPFYWDYSTHRVKNNRCDAEGKPWHIVNAFLSNLQTKLAHEESQWLLDEYSPTKEELKRALSQALGRSEKQNYTRLIDGLKRFRTVIGTEHSWSYATNILYKNLENQIKEWDSSATFEMMNRDNITSFLKFVREKRNLRDSTLRKVLTRLKTLLEWGYTHKLHKCDDYKHYRLSTRGSAKSEPVFLEWEELMCLYNLQVPYAGSAVRVINSMGKEEEVFIEDVNGIAHTRDIFCFCAFTSLRYSDAQNLRKENFVTRGGQPAIELTMVKTGMPVLIHLNKYALGILKRYEGIDLGDWLLPRISNQRMNNYLKTLGKLCGLFSRVNKTYYRGSIRMDDSGEKWEFLSTHVARKTFISNALALGIPMQVVMSWSGHSSFEAMKPYIGTAMKCKMENMKVFDTV